MCYARPGMTREVAVGPEFHNAVRARAAHLKLLIVTDYGEREVPEDIATRWRACKTRKDGRPDRRTKEGRALYVWECEYLKAAGPQ
jgi:hypothetical protein